MNFSFPELHPIMAHFKDYSFLQFFKRMVFWLVFFLIALSLQFIVYVQAEQKLSVSHQRRIVFLKEADELRRTSDDLTRMAHGA